MLRCGLLRWSYALGPVPQGLRWHFPTRECCRHAPTEPVAAASRPDWVSRSPSLSPGSERDVDRPKSEGHEPGKRQVHPPARKVRSIPSARRAEDTFSKIWDRSRGIGSDSECTPANHAHSAVKVAVRPVTDGADSVKAKSHRCSGLVNAMSQVKANDAEPCLGWSSWLRPGPAPQAEADARTRTPDPMTTSCGCFAGKELTTGTISPCRPAPRFRRGSR